MQKDFDDGALGMKIFPAYSQLPLDHPSYLPIYKAIADADRRIIFSFEDTLPGKTPSVADYWHQLDWMLSEFPEIKVQINHGGAGNPDDPVSDPLNPEARLIFDVVGRHDNVWLSTAWLGKRWEDNPNTLTSSISRAWKASATASERRNSSGQRTGPG